MIDIKGLDKAKVLLALYRASHPQGLSILAVPTDQAVTIKDAREAINDERPRKYFDYWNGHVLKVDLTSDEVDPRLYDRDNYPGAAADAIEGVR